MKRTNRPSRPASPNRRWLAYRAAAIAVVKASRHMPLEAVSLDAGVPAASDNTSAMQWAQKWLKDARRSLRTSSSPRAETNVGKSAAATAAFRQARLEQLARQAATVILAPTALTAVLPNKVGQPSRIDALCECLGRLLALERAVFGEAGAAMFFKQFKLALACLKKQENLRAVQTIARVLLRKTQLSAAELERLIRGAKRESRDSHAMAA